MDDLLKVMVEQLASDGFVTVEAPVTMFRVYWICPGVSAIMNFRLGVAK